MVKTTGFNSAGETERLYGKNNWLQLVSTQPEKLKDYMVKTTVFNSPGETERLIELAHAQRYRENTQYVITRKSFACEVTIDYQSPYPLCQHSPKTLIFRRKRFVCDRGLQQVVTSTVNVARNGQDKPTGFFWEVLEKEVLAA